MKRVLDLPELNVFVFSLLFHFGWEMLQIGGYEGMADARHADATWTCLRATFGDGVIAVFSYWTLMLARGRAWILAPRAVDIAGFSAIGVAITIALERVSVGSGRWAYSEAMPVVLGVGLAPITQWLVLPPLVVFLVRRQIR